MENIPGYITVSFVVTTVFTVFIFYKATNSSKLILLMLTMWMVLQAFMGKTGFYLNTNAMPPRLALTILPPVVMIIFLFSTNKGRRYINLINLRLLFLVHLVRIPVELVLFGLFIHKTVPRVMTFEGFNPDIISGLSAIVIFYFLFVKKNVSRKVFLAWNFLCLLLLINIVVIAILSVPYPFQRIGIDQPNIAILHVPFTWLPSVIVPLVLFAHLTAIYQTLKNKSLTGKDGQPRIRWTHGRTRKPEFVQNS